MAGEDPFKVEGRVVEVLSERTYRVELPNGHRLLGYVTARAKAACGKRIEVQDRVRLQLAPFDLSEGRILAKADERILETEI
jgi:translation initiation factor IF-1